VSASALRDKTCFFSGHRDIPPEQFEAVQASIGQAVEYLITQGVQYFCVGGAFGFDTLAALTVLQRKQIHPEIRLALILPCKGHDFSWQGEDKTPFEKICAQADRVLYTSDRYYSGCMNKRNRHMADVSAWGIVYLDRETGGTAYITSYARSVGVKIVNLADEEEPLLSI